MYYTRKMWDNKTNLKLQSTLHERKQKKKNHKITWRAQCKVLQSCRKNSHMSKIKMWKCNTVVINSSAEETKPLIHASITSRIDYCNSLLYGLPTLHLHKLQHIVNAAARPGARLICPAPHHSATSHNYCMICIGYLLRGGFTSRC